MNVSRRRHRHGACRRSLWPPRCRSSPPPREPLSSSMHKKRCGEGESGAIVSDTPGVGSTPVARQSLIHEGCVASAHVVAFCLDCDWRRREVECSIRDGGTHRVPCDERCPRNGNPRVAVDGARRSLRSGPGAGTNLFADNRPAFTQMLAEGVRRARRPAGRHGSALSPRVMVVSPPRWECVVCRGQCSSEWLRPLLYSRRTFEKGADRHIVRREKTLWHAAVVAPYKPQTWTDPRFRNRPPAATSSRWPTTRFWHRSIRHTIFERWSPGNSARCATRSGDT